MNRKPAQQPTVSICNCGSRPKHAKFHSAKGDSRPFFSKSEGRELLTTLISLKHIAKTHKNALLEDIAKLALPESSRQSGKGMGHQGGVLIVIVISEPSFGSGDKRGH